MDLYEESLVDVLPNTCTRELDSYSSTTLYIASSVYTNCLGVVLNLIYSIYHTRNFCWFKFALIVYNGIL